MGKQTDSQPGQPLATGSRGVVLAQAISLWREGVESVSGGKATFEALKAADANPWKYVLAVGKAGSAMLSGAMDFLAADAKVLLVTKIDHADAVQKSDHRIAVIESGHPMPDEKSLLAGKAALDFVAEIPKEGELLVLVSGGASALMESPAPGLDLAGLQSLSQTLLADGYSIDQINSVRIAVSQIKGGKLLRRFSGKRIQVYGLSDIPGDDADLIGSGIAAVNPPQVAPFKLPEWILKLMQDTSAAMAGQASAIFDQQDAPGFEFSSRLVGSNAIARHAVSVEAGRLGLNVVEAEECLTGDVADLAPKLARRLSQGPPGVYLWGGEPTVQLPKNPGCGGRNQSLALLLALALKDLSASENNLVNVVGVIAGSDGTDGPTTLAGGLLDSDLDLSGAEKAVREADAGTWLKQNGYDFVTGPTGTNVMDLAVLIKFESQV